MDIVYLSRTARILNGHLWVFSNELAQSPKGHAPGSLVELRDRKDTFLGIGYINPHSLIAVRILTRQKEEINADFFARRIRAAVAYRKRFIAEANAYRVVHSEGDFLPGLIVDRYDTCLSVQIVTAGMETWTETVLSVLDELFHPAAIVLRNDSSSRLLEGLKQEKKIVKGALDALPVIQEGDVRLEADLLSGQKTGFFLDQRENRMAFSALVGGGEGLDLFCYSGVWGMHLARKGCIVTGIDASENALALAQRNAGINGLEERCTFRRGDVFQFLADAVLKGEQCDFIVLDPPAFVKSGAKVKEALRAYREINGNALRLLKEGGLLATSSCSYHVSREAFAEMLRSSAHDAGRQVSLIEMRSQARDHPVSLAVPETEYLKCAFLEIR